MDNYQRLGGASAVMTAVSVFYQRVLHDPALAGYFAGVDMERLRAHQQAFLTHILGGPDHFTGRSVAAAHARLAISGDAFDRTVEHAVLALRDLGADEEILTEVRTRMDGLREQIVTSEQAPADC
ncbi:group I truncated hemoglobin [Nocardioides limicola]|uniref:group I truncated hemoglobin n=1 Tax=Nocardioides limicola TaxID=2803368 RepID=UPI00193C59A1|nr:group 1 truncated hemoglobin [Nocardioides sp. DJM-14]